jgi:hypothetical protein
MSKASTLVSFLVMVCLLGGVRCVQWQAASNISAANHTLVNHPKRPHDLRPKCSLKHRPHRFGQVYL